MTHLADELAQRFVPRDVIGLVPAKSRTALHATFGTSIHYAGAEVHGEHHASCPSIVRGFQLFHMHTRGWADIAYSACACRHGYIYEGRGRGIRTAANGTNHGNDVAHAVCALIGPGDTVTGELLDALAVAAAWLNAPGEFGDDINGHRDWKSTACPDDPLYHALGDIRHRAAALAEVAAGPIMEVPPVWIGPKLAVDDVHVLLVNVPVEKGDRGGRGYVDLRAGAMGLTRSYAPHEIFGSPFYAGENPSDGWEPDKSATLPVEVVNVGGVARITIRGHELEHGYVGVYVTVAS